MEITFALRAFANLEEKALKLSCGFDGHKGGREGGRIKGKPSLLSKMGSLISHIFFNQRHPQNKGEPEENQALSPVTWVTHETQDFNLNYSGLRLAVSPGAW